jgi:hypothetical protein
LSILALGSSAAIENFLLRHLDACLFGVVEDFDAPAELEASFAGRAVITPPKGGRRP